MDGAGLGDRFLRHVERTRLLLHLLDPEPALMEQPDRSPEADYSAIRAELEAHHVDLATRPEKVRLTKADLVPDHADREKLEAPLRALGLEPRWISSVTHEGIADLLNDLAGALEPE